MWYKLEETEVHLSSLNIINTSKMDDFGNSSTILLHASQPEGTKHLKVTGIICFVNETDCCQDGRT